MKVAPGPAPRPAPLPRRTKAEMLAWLEPRVRSARVLPQQCFSLADWRRDAAGVIERLRSAGWLERELIVRSSARHEDAPRASQAGRYPSFGACVGPVAVSAAIDSIFNAYAAQRAPHAHTLAEVDALDDQVFVQPWLRDVRLSGVALTRDPSNGSHHTVISCAPGAERTDAITAGHARERLTHYRHRACAHAPRGEHARELAAVLRLVDELSALLEPEREEGREGERAEARADAPALDLEFAFDAYGELHVLQLRMLELTCSSPLGAAGEARALEHVRERLAALSQPHPYVYGARAVFGTMPDWNPAEVLGARPKALALSLYKELVTDSIWAYQRSNYGYRDLRSFPLLISLGGLPYVDVRVSFNSFVPAELEGELGRRLVDHYTERLLQAPVQHDKIEFSIVHSCYALDLRERLAADLGANGFTQSECERLAASLRSLTNRISAGPRALFRLDAAKIRQLESRQRAFEREARALDPLARAYWLLEDCKRYGTLPFAGIARAAFIARQMLDSLVTCELMTETEREHFLRSLSSVRAGMHAELARLPRADFLRRYGHLRPGMYDVESLRYDEAPEAYFDWDSAQVAPQPSPEPFELGARRARQLDDLLARHGLEHEHASLLGFIREALEGREHAKFTFSRSLSDALLALQQLAEQCGCTRAELAFADVQLVQRLHASSADVRAALRASIEAGRERYELTRQLTLPPLISEPEHVFAFDLPPSEPNYVTSGHASGPVVRACGSRDALRGAIAMMPSADPGHDWIFCHGVAGFITMYGGYNSHMAIRANELGIPAVIGTGEALYRSWERARRLRIDCSNRRVEVLA